MTRKSVKRSIFFLVAMFIAHLLYRSSRREFTQVSALERMVLKSVPSHLLERYLTAAPLKSVHVLNVLQQTPSKTLFVFLAFPATSCF